MKHFIYIILILLGARAYAQKESTIYIKLENSEKLNIEKRRFFTQPDYQKIGRRSDASFAFQLNRGDNLPSDQNFKVLKVDKNNYVLKLVSHNPELVFINYQPIYVEPGDSTTVRYVVIEKTFDQLNDTLISTGPKKGNYEFAKYGQTPGMKLKYPEPNSIQYKDKTLLFYKDLKNYYSKINDLYDTDSKFKNCSKGLVDYLKRKNHEAYLFRLIFLENKFLQDGNKTGGKLLGDSLETNFTKTAFNPNDTLNFTMENLFKKYFERMVTNKFGSPTLEKNYKNLYDYINNFENKFVKDYFVMLLVANYRKEVDLFSPQLIENLDKEILSKRVLVNMKKTVI